MKKSNTLLIIPVLLFAITLLSNCKKENNFLAAKPNQALAVPTTVNDLQLLIDNEDVFNRNYPALGEISTDDYFVDPGLWLSSFATSKNAYIWAKSLYIRNLNVGDWNFPYQQVYYANTVLDVLPKIAYNANQQSQVNTLKGSALFFRAIAFYNLVQTFAMPYDSVSAGKDLGIPLPMTTDLTVKVQRSTESVCYAQVISDLSSALQLLPQISASKTKPSKATAFGLLSRVYLAMGNYQLSLANATSCLGLYNQLQDFNALNPAAFPVYPNFSPEELFHASMIGYDENSFQVQVDSNLYRSFNDPNDLRPSIYFFNNNGQIEFNSQFDINNAVSCTISTDEIYLNKAECEARLNDPVSAMKDLNTLLVNRWVTNTYKPYNTASAINALTIILNEKRKELVFTGLRWSDLRRLNKDTRFSLTLTRNLNGTLYSLPPNDPRYAMPIPDNELALNPIPQNNR